MINESDIRALVPHSGAMCFWQYIEHWDEQQIIGTTHSHQSADHPLRHENKLSAIHLAEYGAQLLAIHGGLLARDSGHHTSGSGFMAALKDFELHRSRLDDLLTPLQGNAEKLMHSASGSIYRFRIESGGLLLASGRVSVITQVS